MCKIPLIHSFQHLVKTHFQYLFDRLSKKSNLSKKIDLQRLESYELSLKEMNWNQSDNVPICKSGTDLLLRKKEYDS